MFVFALILPVQVFGQDPPRCEFHQVDFNSQEEADAHFDPALNPVCHDCGMTFGGEQELVAHEMAEHPPRCDEHDITFASHEDADQHFADEHPPVCPVCGESFGNWDEVNAHEMAEHPPRCDEHDITFASHEDADQHFADEHPPVCPVCGESFGNWDEVNAHEMAEHPPRCDQHDITFDSHEAADAHFDTVEHDMGPPMGPPFFSAVGDGDDCINIDEAFGFFGQGESIEEFANGDEEDPGFNDIAESDENDSVCGDEEVNRKEFFKATYREFNKMNDEQDMGMGQATMANCAAWCAGIDTYKYRITEDTKSDPMARYEESSCMCSPGFVYPDN